MNNSVHEYQGVVGLPKIAKLVGIPMPTLRYRIYLRKMTLEEAIKLGAAQKDSFKHEYRGFTGLREIANAFGINQRTLESRVIQRGMSIEDALSKPVRRRAVTAPSPSTKKVEKLLKPEKSDSLWNIALGVGGC
ncbi:hypothetical protein [Vibrio harveyi]|uniref:HTH psq-type domain-containing protein n=1 Tax=Vibrio harveyi TaxID=669 RepID=A0ABN4L6L3_VIBHA|nr:hypothetical protein [Vibrio harveyi]EKG9563845.1 hypothetical protein [Vibrio parahaemolyticus]AMG01328.1 hypothetical protein AL538_27125 [Vibrio harveyi]EKG9663395.1 hypothetical protein [Vibrio parahaemolyticus]EKG9668975.1 hypothetical protein [Vibrio parahaemolyticus]ELY1986549.1 hypothetical protein [Vibrio harveyi]